VTKILSGKYVYFFFHKYQKVFNKRKKNGEINSGWFLPAVIISNIATFGRNILSSILSDKNNTNNF